MKQHQTEPSSWFFTRFFLWLGHVWRNVLGFFLTKKKDDPSIDIALLVQHAQAPKSWFDKLCSFWVNQPFWMKGLSFIGVGLCFGLFGLLLEAPVLCSCSALFVSAIVHLSFVSHEKKRLESINLQMEETLALNAILQKNKTFFEEATRSLELATSSLTNQSKSLGEQVETLEKESTTLHLQDALLLKDVENIHQETDQLMSVEKRISQTLATMTDDFHTCHDVMTQTCEDLSKFEVATEQFSNMVSTCSQTQQQLSETVNRFTLFVNQPPVPSPGVFPKVIHQQLITNLREENDADDILIQTMKHQMGFCTST